MSLRIIYMGTPEFAIPPLQALIDAGYPVIAVVTAPDKPSGRGKKLSESPVKKFALEQGIKVLQPEKLKDPGFISELESLKPDLQVVVAFRMLPKQVWSIPPKGTFNLHASLLPQYRGAAPINWAIINGEKKTGLTTFFIDEKIDTGEIIARVEVSIGEDETAGELHDRMMFIGAELALQTVKDIENERIKTLPQSDLGKDLKLKPAPKIFREDCKIDWNNKGESVHNFIRGLSPYPAAWTLISDQNNTQSQLKIYLSDYENIDHGEVPGTLISDQKNYLKVAVQDGFTEILEVQLAGKKRLNIKEFLIGFPDITRFRV